MIDLVNELISDMQMGRPGVYESVRPIVCKTVKNIFS